MIKNILLLSILFSFNCNAQSSVANQNSLNAPTPEKNALQQLKSNADSRDVEKKDRQFIEKQINKNSNDEFVKESASIYKQSNEKHFLKKIFPALDKFYDSQINKFLFGIGGAILIIIWLYRKSKKS
jgi:hypothetical protein